MLTLNLNPIIFIGHRAFDGASIASVMPVTKIYSCDSSDVADALRRSHGIDVTVLESVSQVRERWTSSHIDFILTRVFDQISSSRMPVNILPYAATHLTDKLRNEISVSNLFCVPASLRRLLDDKRHAKEIFYRLGLPTLKALISEMSRPSIAAAASEFGYPLVVRPPTGSTGSNIYKITSDKSTIERACQGARSAGLSESWILEPFVEGFSLNVNAVATSGGCVIYAPSVQLIGIPQCTDVDFGFCGNDFFAAERIIDANVRLECERQTTVIGEYLISLGYRGLFGIDYIVAIDGNVYACEINPRLQNSTALLNFMMAPTAPNLSPAQLHVECFALDSLTTNSRQITPTALLSQVIVYHSAPAPSINRGSVVEGRYKVSANGTCILTARTFNPQDIQENEILVAESISSPGMRILPGAPLFKLLAKRSVLSSEGTTLADWVPPVIDDLKRLLFDGSRSG